MFFFGSNGYIKEGCCFLPPFHLLLGTDWSRLPSKCGWWQSLRWWSRWRCQCWCIATKAPIFGASPFLKRTRSLGTGLCTGTTVWSGGQLGLMTLLMTTAICDSVDLTTDASVLLINDVSPHSTEIDPQTNHVSNLILKC